MKYDETYIYIYVRVRVFLTRDNLRIQCNICKSSRRRKIDHEEADDPIYGEHISMEGGGEESIRVNQG